MMRRVLNFISSLKLTVACLVFALIITFVGTLAQVKLGLYMAQEQYFRSVFVWWGPQGADWKIPVLPGGWLLGTVLLINLLAAHAKRFKFTRQKAGIFLIHFGLIFLLVGQFVTEISQVESVMHFTQGQTKNYSESQRTSELVLIDKSSPSVDKVVAIPESMLKPGRVITHSELPFSIKVANFFENSEAVSAKAAAAAASAGERISAAEGAGRQMLLLKAETVRTMDKPNIPSTGFEVTAGGKSLGTWLASPWVGATQTFDYDGKTWEMALRFKRYYKDFSVTLLKADHDIYVGTDIPKNFSSRVRIDKAGEPPREVRIYMNSPLRYAGETYYQYQMGPDEAGRPGGNSTLQVVRNPVWLTPYISCSLVGGGLVVQFLMHLFAFAKRSGSKPQPPAPPPSSRADRKKKRNKPSQVAVSQEEPDVVAARKRAQA